MWLFMIHTQSQEVTYRENVCTDSCEMFEQTNVFWHSFGTDSLELRVEGCSFSNSVLGPVHTRHQHKWTALSAGVNTSVMHLGRFGDQITSDHIRRRSLHQPVCFQPGACSMLPSRCCLNSLFLLTSPLTSIYGKHMIFYKYGKQQLM